MRQINPTVANATVRFCRPLQLETSGAIMGVTRLLKPSIGCRPQTTHERLLSVSTVVH